MRRLTTVSWATMNNKLDDFFLCTAVPFVIALIAGILGGLASVGLWYVIGKSELNAYLFTGSVGVCSSQPVNSYCGDPANWNSETYLSAITDFYSDIITVLVAIIGLIGVLGFLYIKSHTVSQLEDAVDKGLEKQSETIRYREQLENIVDDSVKTEIGTMLDRIEEIERVLVDEGFDLVTIGGTDEEKAN